MRSAIISCLALGVLTAAATADDANKMQGSWTIVSSLDDGQDVKNEIGGRVRISDTEIILDFTEKKDSLSYKLDPSKSPKWIDLIGKKVTYLGIYELDGDTLKICFSESGKERSTKFESLKNTQNDRLIVLKRMK